MSSSPPDPPVPASRSTVQVPPLPAGEQVIRLVVEAAPSRARAWNRLLWFGLIFSILMNFSLFTAYQSYFSSGDGPNEKYHSGDKTAKKKIAIIQVSSTIMPPFTERLLERIEKAESDGDVEGVVLVVDSPGGLVADSHQLYHRLQQLGRKKPLYVQMQRIAASGGYYIAMAAGDSGKIMAEPTTWTGSIGVIIPHYDFTDLAEKAGVKSEPLTTGEFKDALSSFRPLTDRERTVWTGILDDAYQRFLGVIEAGRPNLSREQVEAVATGRIYTADQAVAEGLVDGISFLEDTIEQLQKELKLEKVRVIEYQSNPTLTDLLLGAAQSRSELSILRELWNSPAPRAFYLMGQPDTLSETLRDTAINSLTE